MAEFIFVFCGCIASLALGVWGIEKLIEPGRVANEKWERGALSKRDDEKSDSSS